MTPEKALQCLLSVIHDDPGHTHLPVTPDLTQHIQIATAKAKVPYFSTTFPLSSLPLLLNQPFPQPILFLCRSYQLLFLSPLGHTLQRRHILP